jgi:hypothetical protein
LKVSRKPTTSVTIYLEDSQFLDQMPGATKKGKVHTLINFYLKNAEDPFIIAGRNIEILIRKIIREENGK